MPTLANKKACAMALSIAILASAPHAFANHDHDHHHDDGEAHAHDHDHDHDHDHNHSHDHDQGHAHDNDIYAGYFDDAQIADRALSDWEGDWQSVYPYLLDGTLDPVFAHKAEQGDKTAEEYKAYYDTGYATDVERIVIDGSSVTFFANGESMTGDYQYDGYEILNYEAGNRGVRFIFELADDASEDALPHYIQFSDHSIYPTDAGHYHLYWGDDREALLEELTHWPTYYPSSLSGEEIVDEMLAH
ncbi:metal-binding protein ZinT [Vreelandella piezotolerans]|nr:metal-binding protein ZinT [Halomonas piezotolerans]